MSCPCETANGTIPALRNQSYRCTVPRVVPRTLRYGLPAVIAWRPSLIGYRLSAIGYWLSPRASRLAPSRPAPPYGLPGQVAWYGASGPTYCRHSSGVRLRGRRRQASAIRSSGRHHHTRAVLSPLPLTTYRPSGLNATAVTSPSWIIGPLHDHSPPPTPAPFYPHSR